MAAQEALHAGVEEEAQEDPCASSSAPSRRPSAGGGRGRSADGRSDPSRPAPARPAGCAGAGRPRPAGAGDAGDEVAEVIGRARVAALAHHGVQPAGGQRRELLQRLQDERQVRIDPAGPQRRRRVPARSCRASTRRTASRCTCSWRAMVPTRHFSTVCRRRICATRSGAMVMAPPRQPDARAQPQRRGLSCRSGGQVAPAASVVSGRSGECQRALCAAMSAAIAGDRCDRMALSCVHAASGAAATPGREPWCVTLCASSPLPAAAARRWRQRRERCGVRHAAAPTSAGSAGRPGAAHRRGPGAGTARPQ